MSEYESRGDSSDVACPTCGRTDFKNMHGVKIHHHRAHGESIAGVEVGCANCGASKRVSQARYEQTDRFFCNDDCQGQWQSDHLAGEDAANWQGGTVTVGCDNCGTSKEVKQHVYEGNEHHFCDHDCWGEWASKTLSGENSPRWGRVTVECAYCGDSKRVSQYRHEHCQRHFCHDKNCWGKWASKNRVGEAHPLWTGGGVSYYGPNWNHQRRACMDRDDHRCQICGVLDEDAARSLEVHHIRPIAEFDELENANRLGNLITLCRGCHKRWEGIPLRPQTG